MLEKLGFQQLVEETLTIKRLTRAMPVYQFVLAMVLALYVGFSRLNHLRFLEREPMLTGHSESIASAAAMHLLAVSGLAASERGRADPAHPADDAAAGVGSRACGTENRHLGHRHHGAHPVRPPNGRAQELQPEEPGQEKLSAYVQRRLVYSVGVNPTRTKVRVL